MNERLERLLARQTRIKRGDKYDDTFVVIWRGERLLLNGKGSWLTKAAAKSALRAAFRKMSRVHYHESRADQDQLIAGGEIEIVKRSVWAKRLDAQPKAPSNPHPDESALCVTAKAMDTMSASVALD